MASRARPARTRLTNIPTATPTRRKRTAVQKKPPEVSRKVPTAIHTAVMTKCAPTHLRRPQTISAALTSGTFTSAIVSIRVMGVGSIASQRNAADHPGITGTATNDTVCRADCRVSSNGSRTGRYAGLGCTQIAIRSFRKEMLQKSVHNAISQKGRPHWPARRVSRSLTGED
jgi:hypothetical protein